MDQWPVAVSLIHHLIGFFMKRKNNKPIETLPGTDFASTQNAIHETITANEEGIYVSNTNTPIFLFRCRCASMQSNVPEK